MKSLRQLTTYLLIVLLSTVSLVVNAQQGNRDEVVFFFNDALGSAVAAINEQGELCWSEEYTGYGDKTINDDLVSPVGCGIIGEERGFTGHTEDVNSDLVYMQQRYYDPSIGRFLSIDPMDADPENPMTHNRYAYANNNPYRYVDPDGRATVSIGVELKVGIFSYSGGISVAAAVSFPEPFTRDGMNDNFDLGLMGTTSGAPPDIQGLETVGLGAKFASFVSVDRGDIQDQRGLGFSLGGQFSPTIIGTGLGAEAHFGRDNLNSPFGFSGGAVSIGLGTEFHSVATLTGTVSAQDGISLWGRVVDFFSHANTNSHDEDSTSTK